VRHAYAGITLGNDATDWLALRTPTGIAVDSVSWGAAAGDVPSPPSAGVARSLASRDSPNVNLSGAHAAWEDAVGTYGPTLQRGTPGRANLRGVRGGLSISAGYQHTCMTDRDGAAWCWGLGSTYQLGTGGTGSAFTLARAAAPAGVRLGRVSLAGNESCALSFLGEAYCWGYRPGGYASVPTSYPNAAASLVTSVAAGGGTVGGGSVCEIDPAGAAYCWGNVAGDYYFLWIAQTAVSPAMTWPVSQMALGTDFACALGNGRVYCYGLNAAGQVGDSTTSFRPKMTETRLPQGVTFRSIAAAFQTACALSDAGQAYCWGKNQSGQLGNGTSSAGANPMPVAVQQPAGVAFTALSMGEYQGKAVACGLDADGQAWCWGQNDNGRVGDGTEAQRLVPTAVAQRGVRFTALAVGGVHTCALEAGTGQPFCWGANVGGAVGDGSSTAKRLIPVPAIRQ
jgi:alpha-tubulin suppressor-like RCC1 family protein